jgi:hypothetical protein
MHGPPLAKFEIAALLRRQVDQLESQGSDRSSAVATVAGRYDVEAHRVAWLIGDVPPAEPLCADRAGVEAS